MTAVVQETGQVQAFSVQIPASELINAVKAVALASDSNSGIPILSGVSVTLLDKGIVLAATDRYRLAEARYGFGDVKATALVNAKELVTFIKSIKPAKNRYLAAALSVTLEITGEGLTASYDVDGLSRSFRAIGGSLPDYSQLITVTPTDVRQIRFSPKYLSDGMDAVALMSKHKANPARLTFGGELKPCVIVPDVALDGWAFKYLLMVMKEGMR